MSRIGTLLVANRGELVVRIAATCRRLGIRCLALAAGDQRNTWWAAQADGIVELPPGSGYLDGDAIVRAARAAGADAIHPGYGFLAERESFAEQVLAAGLAWVGPPPAAMRALGDKAGARRLAASLGVPVLPGYDGAGQSDEELGAAAAAIGYPLLVKPSAGGGGTGMHAVGAQGELAETLGQARREARAAFGNDALVLERLVEHPRHVEVQVLADAHGAAIHLGERDCSLQRRRQKVVEESPAPGVDAGLRERLGAWAVALAKAAGYVGAGTAEFLVADDGSATFLEFNARLQVEHPVTELVTKLDLVELQLAIAAGDPLPLRQADVRLTGHAIEARLYAEDPADAFAPSTGRVLAVRWASGRGVRVDAGIGRGDEIGTRYDPLLAKVVAHGANRAAALRRLGAALAGTRVVGLTTNRGWLVDLIGRPEVVAGAARTDTIERAIDGGAVASTPGDGGLPPEAWRSAAAAIARRSVDGRRTGFRLNAAASLAIAMGAESLSVPLDGTALDDAEWHADPKGGLTRDLDGRAVRVELVRPPSVEDAERAAHPQAAGGTHVIAPLPGIVRDVRVVEGASVEHQQVVVVLDAMKMEHGVVAPATGRVGRVHIAVGDAVQRGDVLLEID